VSSGEQYARREMLEQHPDLLTLIESRAATKDAHIKQDDTTAVGKGGANWPDALRPEALQGPAGELVRMITESLILEA